MAEFYDRYTGRRRQLDRGITQFRPAVWLLVPLLAVLFQFYAKRLFDFFENLDLALLVTVYFSLMRRAPALGILVGCLIGLAQDSLSALPLGVNGIVLTVVGYFAASMSLRIDVENPAVRLFMSFMLYVASRVIYWILLGAFLGQQLSLDPVLQLVLGVLNSAISLPLFALFDRFREK
jgi:rod shape-determining protein MreD